MSASTEESAGQRSAEDQTLGQDDASSTPDPLAVRESLLTRIDRLIEAGEFGKAAELLQQQLVIDPQDVEVLFRLANVRAAEGEIAQAIELLDAVPEDHPEAGLPAVGQSADWCFQIERYQQAEQKYLRVLELAPGASRAHRQLAYLFNRQGRRHEAARHVRELCKLGDVLQDELHSLIVLTDAMYDDPNSPAENSRPYWPIGALAEARRLFNQQRYDEAVAALADDVITGKTPPAAFAFFGRAAVEAQDDEQFQWWLAHVDDAAKEFADYWAAIGTYLLSERRFQEAARSLGEAVDRDPTDLISMGRLRQALLTLEQDELAEKWADRWRAIRQILRVNNRISASAVPDPDAIGEMAAQLMAIDRNLEAVLWKSIEASNRGMPRQTLLALNEQHQAILKANAAFPSEIQRLCGMDLKRYQLPMIEVETLSKRGTGEEAGDRTVQAVQARFENVAGRIGLDHSFSVAAAPQRDGFAIHQILGGAVAVLDYDLDGAVDLYFGQGAADPPTFRSQQSNQLFRHAGQRLLDVTEASSSTGTLYSTGVTAGDWNQDGFADLVVSNIGDDVMLINNGDGTFCERVVVENDTTIRVPSSVMLADVTGDALPDLFQVAYVDDPDFARRPKRNEQGEVLAASIPTAFSPGSDRLIANDGAGGFKLLPWDAENQNAESSLGLVVTDFDGRGGNEIFIGNDLRPNQFWYRDPSSGQWAETAALLGCGFGYTGRTTASMGIAAADFDGNGSLDIHITNYQKEAANLFLQFAGAYQDRNLQYQLNADSRGVLGFGTQAIDFDNDSLLDLVVTNGHIEKESQSDEPFEQPPQLFRNLRGRFQLVDVVDSSGYWSAKHLGRAHCQTRLQRRRENGRCRDALGRNIGTAAQRN